MKNFLSVQIEQDKNLFSKETQLNFYIASGLKVAISTWSMDHTTIHLGVACNFPTDLRDIRAISQGIADAAEYLQFYGMPAP